MCMYEIIVGLYKTGKLVQYFEMQTECVDLTI